jgi:chromosome segregation ATPase
MPRAPTISYERFKEVATSLKAEGLDLTYRSLRERLGGGSYEVLNRYIELFNKEQAAGMPGMPTNILSGAHALYEQAKADVRRELALEHAQRIEELDAEHAHLQAERESLVARAAQAQGEANVLSEQLRRLEIDLTGARQERDDLGTRLAELDRDLAHTKAAYATAEAQWDEQREALRASVAEASERADNAEKRFLLEMDHMRQALRQFEASRLQEIDSLAKQLVEARAQHTQASEDAARWQIRAQSQEDLQLLARGINATVREAAVHLGEKVEAIAQACANAPQPDLAEMLTSILTQVQEMTLRLQAQTPGAKRLGKEPKR